MPSDSSIRQRVEKMSASNGGYALALRFITSQVALLERNGADDSALMEAHVVRAEVLQKLGNLDACRQELAKVNSARLRAVTGQGYLLIKAKLLMQGGDIKASKVALQQLGDKLGLGNSTAIQHTYLWRQAFTLALLGESGQAKRLADEHKACILEGGFHDANNIIYARILPAIASSEGVGYGWRLWIDAVRRAGMYYVSTMADSEGRHRGKSLCQALLVEAVVMWALGNRFNGYRVGFAAALLLRHWKLGVSSEGIGEILAALDQRSAGLVTAVRYVLDGMEDAPVLRALAQMSDGASAEAAYIEAIDVAAEIIRGSQLGDVYEILDEWR